MATLSREISAGGYLGELGVLETDGLRTNGARASGHRGMWLMNESRTTDLVQLSDNTIWIELVDVEVSFCGVREWVTNYRIGATYRQHNMNGASGCRGMYLWRSWMSHELVGIEVCDSSYCSIILQHSAYTPQRSATFCNTLQHTATHCNILHMHWTESVWYNMLYTATHCNTLQHTATHCNTLQLTATHCNTLYTHWSEFVCYNAQSTATHCNTLQHTKTHYNTLQHTATHCNTL